MRALVTGATGFIGGHLVKALVHRGDEVTCLVRRTSRTASLEGQPVSLVEGDLRDRGSLASAVKGLEVVFHLAAAISAPEWAAYEACNVLGTRNLLEACLEAAPGLRRFVLVSSIAAAGPSPEGRILNEDDAPRPVSNYGRSKLESENLVQALGDTIPVTILRPPNVIGPGLPELKEAIRMIRMRIVPALGSGRPQTSLIDVEDLVQALILAAEDRRSVGRMFFVTDGRAYAWREIVSAVRQALGVKAPLIPVPYGAQLAAAWLAETAGRLRRRPSRLTREIVRASKDYCWIYDGSRFERELGFRPSRQMEDSVRMAVAALTRHTARHSARRQGETRNERVV